MTSTSLKRQENVLSEEQYRHELKHAFRNNMSRLCELQWAKMILLCRLPFLFTALQVVRDTMHYTCTESMPKNLSRARIVHLCTEIYAQTLGSIKRMMLDSMEVHGKRIFSINCDNWKSKNSIRRFTGMRIYFMDKYFQLQTFLLGMREFNPSNLLRGGIAGLRNSMKVWGKGLLKTYDLDFENVFAATTDNAHDVRILTQQDMGASWDWCPPHLNNKLLEYALGYRNEEMQKEISEIKKTITALRDITKDGTLFEETLAALNPELATKKRLKMHQDQRFMGVFLTMNRYYEMFDSIEKTCEEAGYVNGCTLSKSELEQMLSLLDPLREISVKSQRQDESYGYRVLQKLIEERLDYSLNMTKPVKMFNNAKKMISSFSSRVAFTRTLMIQAIDIKFFKRYFQMSRITKTKETVYQSYLLEAQHLLHPAVRHLNPVFDVIRELVQSESVATHK